MGAAMLCSSGVASQVAPTVVRRGTPEQARARSSGASLRRTPGSAVVIPCATDPRTPGRREPRHRHIVFPGQAGMVNVPCATSVKAGVTPAQIPQHYASYTGTAPVEASSGDIRRHRLCRAGNRSLNNALLLAARAGDAPWSRPGALPPQACRAQVVPGGSAQPQAAAHQGRIPRAPSGSRPARGAALDIEALSGHVPPR
jgi:Transposase IS116/IS110/IS902 family